MGELKTYHDSELADILNTEVPSSEKLGPYLRRISGVLADVDLASMAPGMYAYAAVTDAVHDNLGYFDDPNKMADTMPDFATWVLDALRSHVNGQRAETGAWGVLMYLSKEKEVHASISMWSFLTLHVRRDLWRTLARTGTVPELHQNDYEEKINKILRQVGEDLLHDYVKVHPMLAKLGSPQIGLEMMLWDLFRGRDKAWDISIELQAARAIANNDPMQTMWLEEFARKRGRGQKPRTEPEIFRAQEIDTSRRVRRILTADFLAQKVTRHHVGVWHNGFED